MVKSTEPDIKESLKVSQQFLDARKSRRQRNMAGKFVAATAETVALTGTAWAFHCWAVA